MNQTVNNNLHDELIINHCINQNIDKNTCDQNVLKEFQKILE